MNRLTNIIIIGLLFLIIGAFLADQNTSNLSSPKQVQYSEFNSMLTTGKMRSVVLDEDNRMITFEDASGNKFWTVMSLQDRKLIDTLIDRGVALEISPAQKTSIWVTILLNALPFLLLIGIWIYLMRQMQGGGGRGAMSFGKSKARLLTQDSNRVTFDDVAGVEESKEEVQEIIEFLRDPSRFQKLGGRMPTGVLMTGSPGTGKTLLAKAIAGEARVPFFSISGSDFVEMFVGVGASRVRDMFEQAKMHRVLFLLTRSTQ